MCLFKVPTRTATFGFLSLNRPHANVEHPVSGGGGSGGGGGGGGGGGEREGGSARGGGARGESGGDGDGERSGAASRGGGKDDDKELTGSMMMVGGFVTIIIIIEKKIRENPRSPAPLDSTRSHTQTQQPRFFFSPTYGVL